MGGEMFAYGDKDVTINGKTYYAEIKDLGDGKGAAELLKDYGCLHFAVPVVLGVSKPRYDPEWLAEQKKKDKEILEYKAPNGKVIKGTAYEMTQKQRALEREIRKEKGIEMTARAAGNNDLARQSRVKIKAYRTAYDDLCKQTGLQPTLERATVSGYGRSVDKVDASGIIKENATESITKITENAISKIPKIEIDGFTDEQNIFIQEQHKELLRYARDYNDNKEVAFVFRKNLTDKTIFIGNENEVDFGSSLLGQGDNLFIMHNHPKNSSYSLTDLILFSTEDNIKTITIVKNKGNVESIVKSAEYNKNKFRLEYDRLYKKLLKMKRKKKKTSL